MAESSGTQGLWDGHIGGVLQNLVAAAVGAALPQIFSYLWKHVLSGDPPSWITGSIYPNLFGVVIVVAPRLAIAGWNTRRNRRTPRARGDRLSIYIASLGDTDVAVTARDNMLHLSFLSSGRLSKFCLLGNGFI